jgi:hypothetical protein
MRASGRLPLARRILLPLNGRVWWYFTTNQQMCYKLLN